ncbi:MAG: TPM domain-containing protein [Oliverpabstia sp.]
MRMRKKTGYLLLMLLLLLVPVAAWADKTTVDDQAGLFSQEEEQELTDRIVELTTDWNMDLVVVTTEDAEGKTSEEYADDYYDYNGYAEDGALYLIDLDNGSVWISTAGKMIRYLTDERIDAVIDAGYDNLKAKNYADGILEMLNETESYLEDGIPSDQYNYDTETGKISRYRSITVHESQIRSGCGRTFVRWRTAAAVLGSHRSKRKTYRHPHESRAKVRIFTRRDDISSAIEAITQRSNPAWNHLSGGGGGQSSVHTSGSGTSHGGGGFGSLCIFYTIQTC